MIISTQMDYVFLCYGLGFVLLAAACLTLWKRGDGRLPWNWLAVFSLVHGVNEWLDLIAIDIGDCGPFKAIRLCVMAVSFVCLTEFGRRSVRTISGRGPGMWATLLIFTAGCTGWLHGLAGLDATIRYSLGFVGAVWSALAFAIASRSTQELWDRRCLAFLSMLFAAYSIASGLVVPKSPFFPASVVNLDSFIRTLGFPVQLIRGAIAVAAAISIWRLLQGRATVRNWLNVSFTAVFLLAFMVGGWFFVNTTGNATEQEEMKDLLSECRILANGLDPEAVSELDSTVTTKNPRNLALRKRFQAILRNDKDYRCIYLMALHQGEIVLTADSELESSKGYSPFRTPNLDAPQELRRVFSGRLQYTSAKYTDKWGEWVSAFVPVRDPKTGQLIAVLGMDQSQEHFRAQIAKERLEPIVITLLIILLVIGFRVAYERQIWSLKHISDAQQTRQETERMYRQILNAITDLVLCKGPGSRIVWANQAFRSYYGMTNDELKDMIDAPFNEPDFTQQYVMDDAYVFQTGKVLDIPAEPVTRHDGEVRQFHTVKSPIVDLEGEVIMTVGISRDITERLLAQEALQTTKEELESFFSVTLDMLCIADEEGHLLKINAAWQRTLGYPISAIEGTRFIDYVHPEDIEATQAAMSELLAGRFVSDLINRYRCQCGTYRWFEWRATPLENGLIYAAARDITIRVETESKLAAERKRLATTLRSIGDGVIAVDINARVTLLNPVAEKLTGWNTNKAKGMPFTDVFNVVDELSREKIICPVSQVLETGEQVELANHAVLISRNGDEHPIADSCAPIRDDNGTLTGVVLVFRDVTERKQAESQIRLHAAALDAADDLIAITDQSGRISSANTAFRRQTGLRSHEIIGQHLSDWLIDVDSGRARHNLARSVQSGVSWSGEMICRSKTGPTCTADVSITPLPGRDGSNVHLIVIARNITEKKAYESMLDYQAHHDALTDLPNRLLFSEELAKLTASKRNRHWKCAVLFIDLDKFKIVNDTLGHQTGDMILVEAAARLTSCLREGDVLARMGGDEFTALIKNLHSPQEAAEVASRMLERISVPFDMGDTKLVIGASIGISIYPDNATDVEGLLKSADAAMYRAKDVGRNNYQFYSEELHQTNVARLELERDLRLAMKRGELKIHFQPIVEVQTMRLIGAEALLRWDHPKKGMISPALFVPVAEDTGLIVDIGRMVLESACAKCQQWRQLGYEDFVMSVNASPLQLRRENFVSDVLDILTKTGVPPHCLNLEITETVLAKNEYGEMSTLTQLRDHGITACLDDFGIGYSSLSRLKEFPIIHMKVDGSFIKDIEFDLKDRAMTESIITLAHNLGIHVTAEWIENDHQMATIKALGCDYAQGFLISPPLSPEAFERFLREWPERRLGDKAA